VSEPGAEDEVIAEADPASGAVGDVGYDDDTVLIKAVRSGDTAAYGVLYARHLAAAKRAASTARPADRDDLVSESFAQVFRMLRAGRGPDQKVRPYLLTTLRNALTDTYRRSATQSMVAEVPDTPPSGENAVESRAHALVATSAFRQLPQRWRHVLWYTEVEQRSPAEVADLLGMTPNGVAALAYRAREALRQAYLDQYLPASRPRACRAIVRNLAKWVRHKLPDPTTKRINAHVNRCGRCRHLAADLEQLNQQLPMLLGPLVAGAPVAIAGIAGTTCTLVAANATGAAAGVAEAVVTGMSIASWAAAAKTLLAGAVVVATTTLGTASSAPPTTPPTDGANDDAVVAQPAPRRVDITASHNPLAATTSGPFLHHDHPRDSGAQAGKRAAKSTKSQKAAKRANKTSEKHPKAAKGKAVKKAKKDNGAAKKQKKAEKVDRKSG
jgi:RNA polymerase sigma factor (sigma-70 family)